MRSLAGILLVTFCALGQQPLDQPRPAEDQAVFRTSSTLVVVNVTAKDRAGKDLAGLSANDFTITENGKVQEIRVFEFQQLTEDLLPVALPSGGQASVAETSVAAPVVQPSFAATGKGEVKYKDRRLLVLFFDESGTEVADQIRAKQAALKFLREQMTTSDNVAIIQYTTQLRIVQDFTSDRDSLMEIVKQMVTADVGLNNGATGAEGEAASDAAYSADSSEFNLFNTDRKLAALENAIKMLGGLPEKKALVYFSSGMSRTGTDNQAQMRSTVNAAIRSNVSLYPVDARGLVATAPLGNATQASPGGRGMFSGDAQRSQQSRFQGEQETLYTLAADTGGRALLDNNDLSMGITQAQKDISSYYILGYYSTNAEADGRYRKIKVEARKGLNAKLDYRTGYFAPKEFKKFTGADREKQLEEALNLEDPITDLNLAIEINYFRQGRDRYFVPLTIKIPGSDIDLAQKGGAESTRLDFIGEVRNARGLSQGSVRDYVTVKLKGDNVGLLATRNLQYDTGFTLQPGDYTVKVLARENETGKIGTFEAKFSIPDLSSRRQNVLPVSSVVLSHERQDLTMAVAAAERNKKLVEANPLVRDRKKLVPSVTRVFRQGQELFVYLEAYEPNVERMQAVLATVGFYQGGVKVFETAPMAVREGWDSTSKAVPVSLTVPLDVLKPGRYICQVSIVSPTMESFAVSRSSIVILPPQ